VLQNVEFVTFDDGVIVNLNMAEQATAMRLYTAVFGRSPDPGGMGFWADAIASHRFTMQEVSDFFINSTEFHARFGEPDVANYVRVLYQNVLGRDGEAEGTNFWNSALSSGMSRREVASWFAGSAEAVQKTANDLNIIHDLT
jgi:hypothetical protein